MEKYLDYTKKINEEELKKVGKELLDGKIVIFPTFLNFFFESIFLLNFLNKKSKINKQNNFFSLLKVVGG